MIKLFYTGFVFLFFVQQNVYAAKSKIFFISIDASLLQDDGLHVSSYGLRVNQEPLSASAKKLPYQSHYPGFDTIYYNMNEKGNIYRIITRFVPGKHYVVTQGCCAMFDFMEYSKHEKQLELYKKTGNNYDKMDSIRLLYHETAPVWVMGKNLSSTDTVYAYYGDHTGMPYAALLKEKKTGPMHAYYGYYSANGASIMFYRFPKGTIKPAEIKNGFVEDAFPHIEYQLASVYCLFFHQEKILATYDDKTKKISLKILK